MNRSTGRYGLLAAAILTLGVGVAGPASAAPNTRFVPAAITDPAGDVYDDDDELTDAPYADIVSADGRSSAASLVLTYKTAKALHPEDDPNWESEGTFTDFLLDTNADGTADFDVEYGVFEGELYVDVYKVDDQEDPPVACTGTAEFANGAHTATVPLSCLGNPRSLGYRVETVYDQDVDDENSLAAYDVAPETGFAKVN
ncbi:hypothetical protein GCM10010124_28700 [Pilimelia terevasa]|uniref:Uncharacterized protein n=1 Tax=Pilimelia terevasa TaxID=53372 RepID=A0A8J3BNM7_9ACTN|nr:hypothetical protein [Pilimelia terevasa]GGK34341.1 hypothetical protein GCM10010124_28700 [Pilimelia terevasa]